MKKHNSTFNGNVVVQLQVRCLDQIEDGFVYVSQRGENITASKAAEFFR